MNQQPVFILGAHKSGTSLIRSIFDGHSQLYVIPVETHFFQNMKYWVDNEYRYQRPQPLDKQSLADSFRSFIRHLNQSSDKMGGGSGVRFDEDVFMNSFTSVKDISDRKRVFETYIESLYLAQTGKILSEEKRIVEKSVEHGEFAQEL